MITFLSLNPSIDRTLVVDGFQPGGLNRVQSQTDVAAGKGVNAALAAAALGEDAECIGFMFREGGRLFEERLSAGGVTSDFLWCEGAVRVNVKVFDRQKGEVTELNTSGMPVGEAALREMMALVARHARHSDYLVLSGSLPPACPQNYYAEIAETAEREGCRVLLDADGERLRAGLQAKPFMIKPNRFELETLVGRRLETRAEVLAAANECVRGGVELVVVSLGGEGALMTNGSEAYFAPGLKIEVKSTVAAGDSMIAGLAAGLRQKLSAAEAFRLGVAAATVRCMTPPDRILSGAECRALAERIQLETMTVCD